MRTNRTHLNPTLALAAVQPCISMRVAATFANCPGSLPTYTVVGGGSNQRQGQGIESLGLSDRRPNQI